MKNKFINIIFDLIKKKSHKNILYINKFNDFIYTIKILYVNIIRKKIIIKVY